MPLPTGRFKKVFPRFFAFLAMMVLIPGLSCAAEIDAIREAIQIKGAKWVAKENRISRLPASERRKRLGAAWEPVITAPPSPRAAETAAALPVAFDWRHNNGNYVTPVRDQGNCGSCWAFSTVAALEAKVLITYRTPGATLNLSEQIVLSCSGAGDCGGGYASYASDFLRDTGTNRETCYPYSGTDAPCNPCSNWNVNDYKFKDWSYVASGASPTIAAVKDAVYQNGPVVVWFQVFADFYSYGSGVYTHTWGAYQGNHFVLVVGWDDSQQALIAKNSWDTDWGDLGGYFLMAYSELNGDTQFGRWTYKYGNAVAPVTSKGLPWLPMLLN